jgi:hypothetical protein
MIDVNSKVNHPVNNRAARMLENMGRRVDPRTLAAVDLMMTGLEAGQLPEIRGRRREILQEILTLMMDEDPELALQALGLVGEEVALTQAQAKALGPEELGSRLILAFHWRLLEVDPEYSAL